MLAHARSAFELLRPARIRADARAAGRALLRHRRSRSARSTATSPRSACSRDRRPTSRACAAATSSRNIAGEDAKGWTTDQAMQKLRGPKGTHGADSTCSAAATSRSITVELDARRGHHPDRARVLHDRRDDRLHPHAGLRREHRSRRASTRCSELASKGMRRLLFDIRGNPGGPLDQAIKVVERVPAARQDDRLHARPRAELGSGLSRDRRRRVHRHSDRRAWRTATAPARRRSSPARCRITTAPTSSARRRSARRSCSRSTASAAARASR